jgi:hypothetical protein
MKHVAMTDICGDAGKHPSVTLLTGELIKRFAAWNLENAN